MLSNRRVRSFGCIREEEAAVLVKRIEGCVAPVDLRKLIEEMNGQVIFRSSFGGRYSGTENGKRFMRLVRVFMGLVGEIHIGDFMPWLGWIGRVNGFDKRLDTTAKELDQILESVIQDRQRLGKGKEEEEEEEDFLDILLRIYNQDASMDRDSIKALLLDVFVGGTDSISTSLEWIMSELLRHPRVMEKLQSEVRGVVKQKQHITQDDLEKMGYMKAVIKENMRLHPTFPLSPRIASKDVQIKGYDVAAGTMAMVNTWAIGRELVSWDEPDKFMPERFFNSSIDFKGQDFEFIPFGTGRRGCPGIAYATATMELVLANLVQKFDWKLPIGILPKQLDMTESSGITTTKALPLLALASHARQFV